MKKYFTAGVLAFALSGASVAFAQLPLVPMQGSSNSNYGNSSSVIRPILKNFWGSQGNSGGNGNMPSSAQNGNNGNGGGSAPPAYQSTYSTGTPSSQSGGGSTSSQGPLANASNPSTSGTASNPAADSHGGSGNSTAQAGGFLGMGAKSTTQLPADYDYRLSCYWMTKTPTVSSCRQLTKASSSPY